MGFMIVNIITDNYDLYSYMHNGNGGLERASI
jgi:hypothetical protein